VVGAPDFPTIKIVVSATLTRAFSSRGWRVGRGLCPNGRGSPCSRSRPPKLPSKTCQNLPSNLSKPVLKPVAARADYQLAAPLRHGLSIAAATTGFDRFRPADHAAPGTGIGARYSSSSSVRLSRRSLQGHGPTKNPIVCLGSDNRHWGLKISASKSGHWSKPRPVRKVWFLESGSPSIGCRLPYRAQTCYVACWLRALGQTPEDLRQLATGAPHPRTCERVLALYEWSGNASWSASPQWINKCPSSPVLHASGGPDRCVPGCNHLGEVCTTTGDK